MFSLPSQISDKIRLSRDLLSVLLQHYGLPNIPQVERKVSGNRFLQEQETKSLHREALLSEQQPGAWSREIAGFDEEHLGTSLPSPWRRRGPKCVGS